MYNIVFVTAKDIEEANKIAKALLEQKLAACVNIADNIKSLFWWEGKIDEANEVLMIIKSKKNLFKKLMETVKLNHSYTVPEIIAMNIEDGNSDYLDWIGESVD